VPWYTTGSLQAHGQEEKEGMRYRAVAIVALTLCATVALSAFQANDPFVGTWKQNNDKSYNSEPYSATIRIESLGLNRVRITQDVIRTAADAAAGKMEHTVNEFPLDGSDVHPSGIGADIKERLPESQCGLCQTTGRCLLSRALPKPNRVNTMHKESWKSSSGC
jgi:hypothetical protein